MSRIYFDMSNVMKRALFVGKDTENGFEVDDPEKPDRKVFVNSAQYGFDNALTLMHSALDKFGFRPKDATLVYDGMNPTVVRARKVQGGYTKSRGKRPNEVYQQLGKLRNDLDQFWLDLGAATVTQDCVEADDILAFLARNSEEPCMVYSHDGDLMRLVGTNAYGRPVTVGNNDKINENPYGPFPFDLITIYKALVGDTGDNIKGAKGFGQAAFLKVGAHYGIDVFYEIEKLIEAREIFKLTADMRECPPLKKLVEDEQGVYDSYALARLYDNEIDTVQNPLQWRYGMVRDRRENDDIRFRRWYGTRQLVHAGNFEQAVKWAEGVRTPFVALDLETATDEESDEWLAEKAKRDEGAQKVDVYGSDLVSCGITLGDNLQHTLYFTYNHAPEDGIEQLMLVQIAEAIERITKGKRVVAHNAQGFELPVLGRHFAEAWKDNGWSGLLPNVHCTKILASYVDENASLGLKPNAKRWLDYDQQTYAEATTIVGPKGTLPVGGKLLGEVELEKPDHYDESMPAEVIEKRQYKMNELTASHVFHYGTDDTVVTAALYNHWQHRVQLEHAWRVYCEVEQLPMYLTTTAFLNGVNISLEEMFEQEKEDDAAYEKAWATLRDFLIQMGWEGTECPTYTGDLTAAQIKEAFLIVTGRPLQTQVRTPLKLAALIDEEAGGNVLASLIRSTLATGHAGALNDYVQLHFKGEPDFNLGSPKQMQKLMYEVMQLPIRIRNKPTDKMRKEGVKEGTPKTDELAIKSALHFDVEIANAPVLNAMLDLKTVETRRKLYYGPYRHIHHPRSGKVHASANQCQTNTRRYSFSDPNLQQLPKKKDGGKFRRVLRPHRPKGCVIVSMDFNGQELRLAAEYSQDENMLSCYVGDNLKDIHSLTSTAIAQKTWDASMTYETFVGYLKGDDKELEKKAKSIRNDKAKPVNFGEQYGAMAKKVAETLMISVEEAQILLDAKKEMFPGVDRWKEEVVAESKEKGYVTSMLGARRHLRDALLSDNYMIASKAERQGPNFKIQGSGAEMTKRAMARMWEKKLHERYDAEFIAPIHDEVVWSVAIVDLYQFIKDLHWCMTQPYATMKVPVVSSISFGPSFGEQIEIGEEPADEAIQKGLKKMSEKEEQAA